MSSIRILSAILLIGVAACDGGPAQVHFPIDHGKVVATLSPQEIQAMCAAMQEASREPLQMACLAGSVVKKFQPGGSAATCETAYNECMAKMQTQSLSCELVAGSAKVQGCNVTVGEYETCTNDTLVLADKFGSRLSCSMTMDELVSLYNEMGGPNAAATRPTSCTSLASRCPTIFK